MILLYAIFNLFLNKFSSWIEFKGSGIDLSNINENDYIDFQCSMIAWLEAYRQYCIYNFNVMNKTVNADGLFVLDDGDGGNNNKEDNKSKYIKDGEKRLSKFLSNAKSDVLDKILNYESIYRIKSGQKDYVIDDLDKLTAVMYDLQKDTIIYHYGVPTKYRFIDYFEMIYVYYMVLCYYKDSKNVKISDKIEIRRWGSNNDNLTFNLEGVDANMEVEGNLRVKDDSVKNFQNVDIALLDIPKISPFSCQSIHPT